MFLWQDCIELAVSCFKYWFGGTYVRNWRDLQDHLDCVLTRHYWADFPDLFLHEFPSIPYLQQAEAGNMISINIYGCQPFYSLVLIREKKNIRTFSHSPLWNRLLLHLHSHKVVVYCLGTDSVMWNPVTLGMDWMGAVSGEQVRSPKCTWLFLSTQVKVNCPFCARPPCRDSRCGCWLPHWWNVEADTCVTFGPV